MDAGRCNSNLVREGRTMTAPAPEPTADMCTRAAKTYDGLGRGAAADTAAIARALAAQAEATRRECEAEIGRLARERDEALARLAEADAVIVTLEDGAWAYGTTEDDLAKLNEWRAEALARHAARAKGDG
jgi:hypothetical protein